MPGREEVPEEAVKEALETLPQEARAAAEQLGLADKQGLPIVSAILQEVGTAGLCAWVAYQEVLESGSVDAFDMGPILAAALPTFERTIRNQERQRIQEALGKEAAYCEKRAAQEREDASKADTEAGRAEDTAAALAYESMARRLRERASFAALDTLDPSGEASK